MFIWLITYLSPLLIGLITPFLMNTRKVTLKHKVIEALKFPCFISFGVSVIIGLIFLFSGAGVIKFLNLLLFLTGFSMMLIALFILLIRLGVSNNLTQFIITGLVVMLCGTVFYANPFIETYQADQAVRGTIIRLAINLNPMLVIAAHFFGHDLLRAQHLYQISLIGPYYPYSYTDWRYLVIGYWVIAIICLILSQAILTRHSSSELLTSNY